MGDEVRMSDEVAAQVKDRFGSLSDEFAETGVDVSTRCFHLESGCGEFGDLIADGLATFEFGWKEIMEAGRLSAGLVAGNTNALKVDLDEVDQDYTWDYDLTGEQSPPPAPAGRPAQEPV